MEKTESFVVSKGLKQGDAISATLLNLALEYILCDIDKTESKRTMGRQIIAYADDIVIITKQRKEIISREGEGWD